MRVNLVCKYFMQSNRNDDGHGKDNLMVFYFNQSQFLIEPKNIANLALKPLSEGREQWRDVPPVVQCVRFCVRAKRKSVVGKRIYWLIQPCQSS